MNRLLTSLLMLCLAVAAFSLQVLGLLPSVTLDQWDVVATVFWSALPFMLCLFLGVLTHAMTTMRPAALALLESVAGLHSATRAELETRSAMNDALMWQARHAAKAQRQGR